MSALTGEERARLDRRKPTDKYTDQDLAALRPHIVHCDPWSAPTPREIHLTQRGFEMVADYTCSRPTGTCDGKVFKQQDWHWERHLRCRFGYGCDPDPNKCVEHRQNPRRVMEGTWWLIEIVEDEEVYHWPSRRIVIVPDCTCAMTEASARHCGVHGEGAREEWANYQPVTRHLRPVG